MINKEILNNEGFEIKQIRFLKHRVGRQIVLRAKLNDISAFGIPFLVARELSRIFTQFSWIILFLVSMVGVWVLGHIDFKYGFWGTELEYSFKKNPEWKRKMEK